ncbi:AmmeMemoRadiSam system protein B [uncultured Thiodictyon sp.]|jgi:AmmeMemoRadiSam system protein B|uniref:AmmeMemoRadiSam system protein B n=1 Tax=uncultured Thiodictyon sp. TaxID=1846217 RepID=UPI0025E11D96|nr:AmmeMemoRadiSam system protein B [uncultured Thiodictyon sp.]
MSIDRQPAVAGAFYPANPAVLGRQVDDLLAGVADSGAQPHPKALIAPHAGYQYSGPIAASAYAQLAPIAARIRRVVLLGPAHRLPFRGIAYPGADRLLTPLGAVGLDREALAGLADLPQVLRLDAAFDGEHCLEVQLPFLQRLLGDFRVVPLIVGAVETEAVAEVIDRLWGGDETLIVISSDLSHYHDYATATRLDRATTRAIEHLEPAALDHHAACGATPLAGLLVAARRRAMQVRTLDLRNSGDTAGPRDQVVGYGAYAVF